MSAQSVVTTYCKDCRFGVWYGYPMTEWGCASPVVQRGLVDSRLARCERVRGDESLCGREGKLFEPKPVAPIIVEGIEPWWSRFIGWAKR